MSWNIDVHAGHARPVRASWTCTSVTASAVRQSVSRRLPRAIAVVAVDWQVPVSEPGSPAHNSRSPLSERYVTHAHHLKSASTEPPARLSGDAGIWKCQTTSLWRYVVLPWRHYGSR